MSTYYTPELEEFRIGFQYEWLNEDKEWVKVDSPEAITPDEYDKQAYGLRVKHLDRDDIEGEGWVCKEMDGFPNDLFPHDFFTIGDEEVKFGMVANDKTKTIEILITTQMHEPQPCFRGTILNLSEFRKLMKQLGIKKA
jgi:hypothetical protein